MKFSERILALLFLLVFNTAFCGNEEDTILLSLKAYSDSIKKLNRMELPKYCYMIRVERTNDRKMIFIGSTVFKSTLLSGLPDSVSMFEGRYLLWYKSNIKPDSEVELRKIVENVGDNLADDLSSDLRPIEDYVPKYSSYYSLNLQPYVFIFQNERLVQSHKIFRFPDSSFYKDGLKFDKNCDLTYDDGVYHTWNLDPGGPWTRTSPMEYLVAKRVEELNDFEKLCAKITIDEFGKVIDVKLDCVQVNRNRSREEIITKALLEMPPWRPGTLNGRRVKYRISVVLK